MVGGTKGIARGEEPRLFCCRAARPGLDALCGLSLLAALAKGTRSCLKSWHFKVGDAHGQGSAQGGKQGRHCKHNVSCSEQHLLKVTLSGFGWEWHPAEAAAVGCARLAGSSILEGPQSLGWQNRLGKSILWGVARRGTAGVEQGCQLLG